MVKKIPFELIKEGQYLKLDIGKMMTVEQMLKMPTLQVLQELGAAGTAGVEHHGYDSSVIRVCP